MSGGARFSPRKRKNCQVRCCVAKCGSTAMKNEDVRFYKLPKKGACSVRIENVFGNFENVDKLECWLRALRIENKHSSMKVCSLHFKPDDFTKTWITPKLRRLKQDAVPSCNLVHSSVPGRRINTELDEARLQRRQIRSNAVLNTLQQSTQIDYQSKNMAVDAESLLSSSALIHTVASSNEDYFFSSSCDKQVQMQGTDFSSRCTCDVDTQVSFEDLAPKKCDAETDFSSRSTCDVGTQVSFEDLAPKKCDAETQVTVYEFSVGYFIDSMKTDNNLSTATGIESFQLLNTIVEIAQTVAPPEHHNTKVHLKERIIMTYVKMKQNVSYCFLALLFNFCTAQHAKKIFFETVQLLSAVLKIFISWPGRDEIRRNIPQCFEGYEDVTVILDCTEVFIQQQSALNNQIITYSSYKRDNTLKVMTGVSPAGNVIFVSSVYGGRVSDKAIFEQSPLLNLLQAGDGIMVDRGFLIDEICDLNRWKLIRPPFLRDKKQFTKSEALETAKIASARVHVERSNQRIKVFRVLGDTMPSCLLPIAEDIFIVICATVNLSAPILKDDKFMTSK